MIPGSMTRRSSSPRAPAARAGEAPEAFAAAAVRATFGRPARVYRFEGFTIEVWNVNLLTKMPK
jgi:hypothetical protein